MRDCEILAQEHIACQGRLFDPLGVLDVLGTGLAVPFIHRLEDPARLAVPHREFLADKSAIFAKLKHGGVLIDVKSALEPAEVPSHLTYWSL